MTKHGENRAPDVMTAQAMRNLEADVIGSGRVTGGTLMARAGRGVVDAVMARWPDLAARPGRAVILCGPGNNGGDGYVVARLLQEAGWKVAVFALGDPASLPADARQAHDAWAALGEVAPLDAASGALADADLVVDALFGIGLSRGLGPDIATVLDGVPAAARRVAVDVPSGLETDTGDALGPAFDADLVVTFHARKPVHAVLERAGTDIAVVDIGL